MMKGIDQIDLCNRRTVYCSQVVFICRTNVDEICFNVDVVTGIASIFTLLLLTHV